MLALCVCASACASVLYQSPPLPTVLGLTKCAMLGHGREHSHYLNKLDFGGQTCLDTVRIAYVDAPLKAPCGRKHDAELMLIFLCVCWMYKTGKCLDTCPYMRSVLFLPLFVLPVSGQTKSVKTVLKVLASFLWHCIDQINCWGLGTWWIQKEGTRRMRWWSDRLAKLKRKKWKEMETWFMLQFANHQPSLLIEMTFKTAVVKKFIFIGGWMLLSIFLAAKEIKDWMSDALHHLISFTVCPWARH